MIKVKHWKYFMNVYSLLENKLGELPTIREYLLIWHLKHEKLIETINSHIMEVINNA